MILALQVALAVAYALLAHAASVGSARAALAALLVLVALVLVAPLAHRRPWAWILAPLLALGAWALHRAFPEAKLEFIGDAGHASSEPGIIDSLIRATDWAAQK